MIESTIIVDVYDGKELARASLEKGSKLDIPNKENIDKAIEIYNKEICEARHLKHVMSTAELNRRKLFKRFATFKIIAHDLPGVEKEAEEICRILSNKHDSEIPDEDIRKMPTNERRIAVQVNKMPVIFLWRFA